MKHYLVVLIIGITSSEVYNIDPKYIPYSELLNQRSLDDASFIKHIQYQAREIPEAGFWFKNENKFTDAFLNKESHVRVQPKKPLIPIVTPIKLNNRYNRLPEVNLKYLINSAEIVNNESVEDFVDFSNEEIIDSVETEDDKTKKPYSNQEENFESVASVYEKEVKLRENNLDSKRKNIAEIANIRKKRMATAIYEGRYKSQDINDVLKSIAINSFQPKKQVYKSVMRTKSDLAKSRLKRSTNIIEEENTVTTISVFKFTGRPTLLNQDLAFKNIHM